MKPTLCLPSPPLLPPAQTLRPWLLRYLFMRFSSNLVKVPLETIFAALESFGDVCCQDGRARGRRQSNLMSNTGSANGFGGYSGKRSQLSGKREIEQLYTIRRRVERSLGLLCVYGAWALMVWYLFFFGRGIYRLLGDPGELAFVKGWLVGLAFQNCYGLIDFAKELGRGLLVLLWLEPLFVPCGKFFEDHLDFVSVQATMFQSSTTWRQRMRRHLQFYAYSDNSI